MRILGIDIGGTDIKAGVVDEDGMILHFTETPTFAQQGGSALMGRIIEMAGKSEYRGIDLIGISTAGQVDAEAGRIIHATDNIPGWTGMEIKKILESKFNVPVAVENDVNAAALGEAAFGAGIGKESFLCVTYGTGIGGAIIENGKIYRGAYGSAGEFGHIITHVGGRACTCGGRGCYEAYASTTALVNDVKQHTGKNNISGRDVFAYLAQGERGIQEIVDNWLNEVVAGLVSLVHIFNPSCIILGGGIMNEPYVVEHIQSSLPMLIMRNYREVDVRKALLGNRAGLLGAAYAALSEKGVKGDASQKNRLQ